MPGVRTGFYVSNERAIFHVNKFIDSLTLLNDYMEDVLRTRSITRNDCRPVIVARRFLNHSDSAALQNRVSL